MSMQLKAVLFDYDGTISDRTRSSYANYRILLHAFFPDLDEHSLEMEARLQRCILWDEYGTIEKKIVMQRIRDKWKPDLDVEEAVHEWYRYFPENQVWTENMKEVLFALKKKYHIGLVTNGPHDRQWPKIRKMGLEDIFETILVSEDFGSRKPDPSIYWQAAENLQVRPEECAYVGDTFETDIAGALRAGMVPIWFCGERSGVTDMDICTIHSAQELLELFNEKA